jgi:RND superfamily putative drug exporter
VSSTDPRHGVLLRRWGRFVARHALALVLTWAVFVAGGFAVALGLPGNEGLFDRLHSGEVTSPGEAQQGRKLLDEAGASGFTTYMLLTKGVDLASPKVAAAAQSAAAEISKIPHVAGAVNPFVVPGGPTSPQGRAYVADGSNAGHGFATIVTYAADSTRSEQDAAQARVDRVFDTLVRDSGAASSERGGVRSLVNAVIAQVKKDGQRGEGIALPVSFVLMVLVFGGFVAAGLPLAGAIASIAGALLSLLGFSYLLELDASIVNVVTVLGLGLCIDYGLLVVSRFREEARALLRGRPATDLTAADIEHTSEHTMDRAGRTVIFSAVIVAISLSGMFVFDSTFIRAIAAAGVSIVLLALAVALSLIPALCVLAARRLLRKGTESAPEHGIFSRLADGVHRAPWAVLVVVTALLALATIPVLGMKVTSSGVELLPKAHPERVLFTDLAAHYPQLGGAQVTLVTRAPVAQVRAWAATATQRPGVASVDPAQEVGAGVVTVGFRTKGGTLGDDARAAAESLRTDRPPFTAYVVGQASSLTDFVDSVTSRAPLAIAFVVLATLVLLFLMTGSIVIPVKALVMNVISLGASLGIVVWIFQEGHLERLLHFDSVGAIEVSIPILVLAFGFGLSMDYEVFLLSRIVELHEQGQSNQNAVTLGLQRSGRIITSAALLMIVVFTGFTTAQLLVMKEMGFALAVAILVDATLVRMLLVPATMAVLGEANWWAPRPLCRLYERWGITE